MLLVRKAKRCTIIDNLTNKKPPDLTIMYLNWVEDGLQHGEDITEKEVPRLCQRIQ